MRNKLLILTTLFLIAFLPACQKQVEQAALTYPVTKKVDQVDDYFGTKVADPYRWLEDDTAEDVKAWVREQNKVTFDYLENIPFREKLHQRVTDIYNYPRYSSPFRAGEYYFFYKNDGLQNQAVVYVQKGLDGEPEVFIDPNELSPDGTVRISLVGFSKDDRYVTYSRSEAGSDWRELKVMEIETKKELSDHLRWVKFTSASWHANGFYYSGFDKPEKGQELTARNKFQKIFYHKLGDPQEKDKLIYEDKEHPFRYKGVDISEEEEYLFLYISEGTHGNELYYKDLSVKGMDFQPLITGFEYDSYPIDNVGDKFLIHTNTDAPNNKVILMDPKNPGKENWKTIIPEKEDVLRGANAAGGQLFCSYLKDANTRVYQHDFDGNLVKEIEFPALGSAYGFYGRREEKILFYIFTSFTAPPTIYKYDLDSGKSEVFRETELKFDPEDYVVKQVFYESKDGTKIPMFIVHREGLRLNGKNPTYLYAYGGFNASITPYFNPLNIVLLENGVVYAVANLRGGGEYGEKWHRAGMLHNKQNVFDDFIAAAEYLIKEKYTSKDKLAIAGASNGGLLVGACMTQRPDLYKVAFPAVGVMDMLRYHKFTVGWGWSVEYGSSDEEEDFQNLYSYSPLHNLKEGISYPATLVTTADHDDRVVPAHSFKFAATLQEKHSGRNPVLIRIETRSGHGASSTTKRIDEATDRFAFMFYNMGMKIGY
ncbi:MAG: prolyl oligopeptidase family serine peptidase [Candidatus Aminicenantes bacterium]|nr:prolyl oligopeptidase family serine peptidase [Candidatus Aminicenantes bacterium]